MRTFFTCETAQDVEAAIRQASGDTAQEFQASLARRLWGLGFSVESEVPCPYRKRAGAPIINGRVDLVAQRDGKTVALELDWKQPRAKSLIKLDEMDADLKVVVLREARHLSHWLV